MLPRYSHTAVKTFAELIPVIVKSLIDITLIKDTAQRNSKTIADASGLLSTIEKWSFLVALDIDCKVLNQLCPTQMAYWDKNYVTILTRAAHWMAYY